MNGELTVNIDPQVAALSVGAVVLAALLLFGSWIWLKKVYQKDSMGFFAGMVGLFFLISLGWVGTTIHRSLTYRAYYVDHIKAAYDAKDLDTASLQFNRAISYLNENGITKGSTATLYPSPKYNVEDWYKQLQKAEASLNIFVANKGDETFLVAENGMPIKVDKNFIFFDRKTLADNGIFLSGSQNKTWQKVLESTGVVTVVPPTKAGAISTIEVAAPEGIANYPNNMPMEIWSVICFFGIVINGIIFFTKVSQS